MPFTGPGKPRFLLQGSTPCPLHGTPAAGLDQDLSGIPRQPCEVLTGNMEASLYLLYGPLVGSGRGALLGRDHSRLPLDV